MCHKPRKISKAYGIGGYKVALASCRFSGVFDTDATSLSIVVRISGVVEQVENDRVSDSDHSSHPVTNGHAEFHSCSKLYVLQLVTERGFSNLDTAKEAE